MIGETTFQFKTKTGFNVTDFSRILFYLATEDWYDTPLQEINPCVLNIVPKEIEYDSSMNYFRADAITSSPNSNYLLYNNKVVEGYFTDSIIKLNKIASNSIQFDEENDQILIKIVSLLYKKEKIKAIIGYK